MSGEFYDVIIVGAGPAGSHAAYELVSSGHSVAVLEQKSGPGLDVCCTGVISTECFDSFGISSDVILTRANSAKFFSPSGRCLRLQTEEVQAYTVERASFDKAVACKAQAQEAAYFFPCRVTDITVEKDRTKVEAMYHGAKEVFVARAVILANGFKPELTEKLGLGKIKNFLIGAQAEIEARDIEEVEVYLGRQIAPGSFAWLVPTSANTALAGLITMSHAKSNLERFLLNPFCQGRMIHQNSEIRQKAVPMGTLPHTYGDRVLIIGEAAGQVKPTTGGGIFFGHIGAKIAAEVLAEALSSDDMAASRLSHYQKRWKARMGREIFLGCRARQAFAKLGDRQIERVFSMLDSWGMAGALLNSPNFSFDWHSRLLFGGLKYGLGYPLRKIRHPLAKGSGSQFNQTISPQ